MRKVNVVGSVLNYSLRFPSVLITLSLFTPKRVNQVYEFSIPKAIHHVLNLSGTGPMGMFAGGVFALRITMSRTPLPPLL